MRKITLTFNVDDSPRADMMIDDLRTAWLEDEGVVIAAGSNNYPVDLTIVKDS